MNRWMTMGGRGPAIGLDLNGSRAIAAEVDGRAGRGGRGRPGRTASIRRPDPAVDPDAAEWRRLAEVLERRGFRGRSISVGVPAAALLLETIELPPPGSGAPLDELARCELAAMHRLSPEQLTAAAIPLPPRRDGGAGRSLAVGCRREDVEATIAGAASAGLRIEHLTAAGLAAAGAVPASDPRAVTPAVRLLVVVGWRWAELVVLREGRLASMRVLPELGVQAIEAGLRRSGAEPDECARLMAPRPEAAPEGSPLDADLCGRRDELTSTYVDRLAVEARRSLAYVEQEHGPHDAADLRVLGEGAVCPGLPEALAEALDLTAGDPVADAASIAQGLAWDALTVDRRHAA